MIPPRLLAVGMKQGRAEYQYIHNGLARISTAFEIKERVEIKLNIPRPLAALQVFLEIYDENVDRMIFETEGEWCGLEGDKDSYLFNIPADDIGVGLYFVRARLRLRDKQLFGHKWAGAVYFDEDYSLTNMMQLTLCDYAHKEAKRIRGGVIYHIFVDRFRRGGEITVPDGARLIPSDWPVIAEYPEYPGAPLINNTFYGGTIWGVMEKLDYIESLGVTAIYLSPIFTAASNHKYDTADYMTVDPIFGGEKAFRALLRECKSRNIELILDGVFNHTGSDSIYFNRYGRYRETGAYQSKNSKYYEWYDFQQHPNQYTSWWGIDILPRINPDNPKCAEYFIGDGGVIDKYASMGVYGFRLDVADELSDDFIAKIKDRLCLHKKDAILYGEVWEDASNKTSYGKRRHYFLGHELDGVMNYPVRSGIIDYLTGRGKDKLEYALTDVTNNAPDHILHNQMNLLGTHDTERILTILGGDPAEGKSNRALATLRMDEDRRYMAVSRLMCAYTVLATIPGIPSIFYGDEAGLEGYGDPFNRMPFPWGKEEERLLRHYKRIGQIRKNNPVYKDGDFRLIHLDDRLLVFSRTEGKRAYVTIVNNYHRELRLSFDSQAITLMDNRKVSTARLAPYNANIYKVKVNSTIEIT